MSLFVFVLLVFADVWSRCCLMSIVVAVDNWCLSFVVAGCCLLFVLFVFVECCIRSLLSFVSLFSNVVCAA